METIEKARKSCPLCNISSTEVLAEFPRWKLARTKTMKGHRERIMIYFKKHAKTLDEQSVGEAYILLLTIGQKFFSHTEQWGIFDPVYATIPDHWHRVASDLDPGAEDDEQIRKTPRVIVHTDLMMIESVTPDSPQNPSEAIGSSQQTNPSSEPSLSLSEVADDPVSGEKTHDTQ